MKINKRKESDDGWAIVIIKFMLACLSDDFVCFFILLRFSFRAVIIFSCVRIHKSETDECDTSHNTWYASLNLIRLQCRMKKVFGWKCRSLWCVWVVAEGKVKIIVMSSCAAPHFAFFSDDERQTHFFAVEHVNVFCTQNFFFRISISGRSEIENFHLFFEWISCNREFDELEKTFSCQKKNWVQMGVKKTSK
jgi:hypothetical protein